MHHEWRSLRADELREQASRNAIVILPVASLEQHGPHLPVEVDSILGETVAARTAQKALAKGQPALVLPVIWTGLSEHHMSFGGTITLDNTTFAVLIEGVVRSVIRHGFRRIVLLNAHGGNENALRSIADDLTPKLGLPIVQFTYWYAAAVAIAKILETQGGLQHACEAETSMMMAIRPDLVARDRIPLAKSNTTPDVSDVVGGGVYMWRSIGSRSASGVIGNPDAATPEKGEALFDAISTALADKLCNPELWELPWTSETVQGQPPIRGEDNRMQIHLTVNGRSVTLDIDATTPLLDVLRNHLDLKGSRYGCGLEQCGSCMVLIDGQPEYACARETGSVAGRIITTIEGLGTPDKPHPIQRAFLQEQAGQCGYCLSGIIISAKALLDSNPHPSRADIVAALDKHLCRCGTHVRIIAAVMKAAAQNAVTGAPA